mgnify:CR=1 FL=1
MFKKLLLIIPIAIFFGAMQVQAYSSSVPQATAIKEQSHQQLLSKDEMSLQNRYSNAYINDVFKDNILLNLAYLSGRVENASQINWDDVRTPSTYEFTLQPGEVFAYHDDVLPEFEGRIAKIGGSHFGAIDGYRSSGALYGDGVCHFATLINWAARDAGLKVVAPTNHNFAVVPGIDPMYGTSIYYDPNQPTVSQMQNLYVENNLDVPVTFVFNNKGDALEVSIYK